MDDPDVPPISKCDCGGYIGWQELPDRWEGSCYGECSGYPVRLKTLPVDPT